MPTVLAPLVTAITGITGAAATTIATAGLYVATTAASYFIQQAMAPKPESGTKLSAVLGGAVNQSFIFGEKETAGSFIYSGTWGVSGKTPNGYLVNVFCLQDLRSESLAPRIWLGKKSTIDTGTNWNIDGKNLGNPVPDFDDDGDHYLGVRFLDGTQSVADPYLRAVFGSDATRPWTANMIGRGRTLAVVTQKYNKDEPEGEVAPTFVVRGIRLYDWRKDSTNGGSGSHRYGNYGTYEHSANPIVVLYNIMRGIYYGSDWMFGGQSWPAARFDNDSWTAAANKCDENVSLAGGGTEKRYRVGGEVEMSEEPWAVAERLLKACNGRIVESGGIYKVYCGGIGAAVFSFTDDNIVISEELTGSLFPAREDIANTITGTYVEPDNAGRQKAFKPRFQADLIADDGGERKVGMDFEYVRSNTQAQRLAKLALKDNRRFRTFTVAFWTEARKIEPGDVVNWTSFRFGFENKKFIVGDVKLQRDGVVFLSLREADPTDADWELTDQNIFKIPVYGDILPASQVLVPTFTAASVTDDDNTTKRRPAIRIRATIDNDFVDCKALLWEVRKRNGDQDIIAQGRSEAFFERGNSKYGDIKITRAAFLPGRRVQIRLKIDPESNRRTGWSAWGTTSFYPGGNDYLELDNARMKISTALVDNDIEMVAGGNVVNFGIKPINADLGDTSNLFKDNLCSDPNLWAATRTSSGSFTITTVPNLLNIYGPSPNRIVFTFPSRTLPDTVELLSLPLNPCAPERRYFFEAYAKLSAFGPGFPVGLTTLTFRIDWYGLDASGNNVFISSTSESDAYASHPANAVTRLNFSAISPAGASFFRLRITSVLTASPGPGDYEFSIGGVTARESMNGVYESTNVGSDTVAAGNSKQFANQVSQHTKQARFVEIGFSMKNTSGATRTFTVEWLKGGVNLRGPTQYILQDDNPFYLQIDDPAPSGDSSNYQVRIAAIGSNFSANNIRITTKAFFG